MSLDKTSLRQQAWWTETGPETCGFCSSAFHVEIAHHCDGCDRPICPACTIIVLERRIALCPECAAEDEPP